MRAKFTHRPRSTLVTLAVVTLALAALLAPGATSNPAAASAGKPFADDTVLVGFEPGAGASNMRAVVDSVGATEVSVVGAGTHVLHVPAGRVEEKIEQLQKH